MGQGDQRKKMKGEERKVIESRALGKTGIRLTSMGFGCASVWGKTLISDEQAEALFVEAYKQGIKFFDTGHNYGNAEKRIGKILDKHSEISRNDIVISTKFGERYDGKKFVRDVSPDWIKKSLEISLRRMNTDYIDLFAMHGASLDDLSSDLFNCLEQLKNNGVIRAFGINTFSDSVLERVVQESLFDYAIIDYNILKQDRELLIKKLNNRGIGVIAGAALAESLYSNRIFKITKRKDFWYFARAWVNFRDQVITGRKYRFINHVKGMTGAQIALSYVLSNDGIASAIFGTTSLEHLREKLKADEIKIPDKVLKKIRSTLD